MRQEHLSLIREGRSIVLRRHVSGSSRQISGEELQYSLDVKVELPDDRFTSYSKAVVELIMELARRVVCGCRHEAMRNWPTIKPLLRRYHHTSGNGNGNSGDATESQWTLLSWAEFVGAEPMKTGQQLSPC